jgi:hypothetical protein
MFSNFGNLFITRPRLAEGTDARLDIRRHDPDQESRRKKDEREQGETFDTDDSATVSIEALRAFLENFLKTLESEKTDTPKISASPAAPVPEMQSSPRPVDGAAAAAAGVYKHVAQKVDRTAIPEVSQDAASAPILEAADIRIILQLIEDLKPLSACGVEYLIIERGESFLASLVAAVARAKNNP